MAKVANTERTTLIINFITYSGIHAIYIKNSKEEGATHTQYLQKRQLEANVHGKAINEIEILGRCTNVSSEA
jgi:hypothetical protein